MRRAGIYETNATNNPLMSSGEPFIAIDPTNPDNLAVIEFAIGSSTVPATSAAALPSEDPAAMIDNGRVKLSTDGGNTWIAGPNPLSHPDYSFGAYPAIAYGPDGTLYVVTVLNPKVRGETTYDSEFGLTIATSRDGGRTFGETQLLTETAPHRPWIEVDNKTGTVYVSTTGFIPKDAKSGDTSKRDAWIMAFEPHLTAKSGPNPAGSVDYSGVSGHHMTAANGVVATVFMIGGSGPGERKTDPTPEPVPESLRDLISDGTNSCSLNAPCVFFQTSPDQGQNWKVHHVPLPAGGMPDRFNLETGLVGPFVAADPGRPGRYAISVLNSEGTSISVLVTDDSGNTWSNHQIPKPVEGRVIKPWLEYSATGVLGYMWKQERIDLPQAQVGPPDVEWVRRSGAAFDVYAAIFCDGGRTWLDPVRVNAETSPAGPSGLDDMSYLAMGPENAHLIWADRRDITAVDNDPTGFAGVQAYYGRVPFSVVAKGTQCGGQ